MNLLSCGPCSVSPTFAVPFRQKHATSEARTHDVKIMRLLRCRLRHGRTDHQMEMFPMPIYCENASFNSADGAFHDASSSVIVDRGEFLLISMFRAERFEFVGSEC